LGPHFKVKDTLMRTAFARALPTIVVAALCSFAWAQDPSLVQQISQLNQITQQAASIRPSRSNNTTAAQQQLSSALAGRQQLVEQLIRTAPSAIRAVRLKPSIAGSLPSSLSGMVETDVLIAGVLEKTIADDFDNRRSVTLWNLHSSDKRVEVVFPEESHPEEFLGRSILISGIGTANVVAVESVQAGTFPGALATGKGVTTDAPAQSPSGVTCDTEGTQNVAVLMMNQGAGGASYPTGITSSYLDNQYFSSTPRSLPTYWNEVSQNNNTAAGQVFGPFNLDRVYSCSETNALATQAIAIAQSNGVDLSGFNRVSIVFPTDATCGFSGLADIGCRLPDAQVAHPYSVSWIPIFSSYTGATELWGTLAHELGHNLGLNHGNSLDFGTIPLGAVDFTPVLPNNGAASENTAINTEYGDSFTVMGQASCGGQYSGFAKSQYLDWLAFSDLYETTGGGHFTLNPYENGSGPRALRILRDAATSSWLWLEYRQPLGTYDSILQSCVGATNVYQGALGYYEGPSSIDGHLFLLDFHASSAPNDFKDAALLPGETWSDPYSPLSVTVSDANSNGLSVSVSYAQPCHSVAISSPTFEATGGSGSVSVTAPSDCSWQASTGSSDWITGLSPASGTGNGAITFTLASNTRTEERTGVITVSRANVTVSQKGTGTYITPMSPAFGSGVSAAIPFVFDDPLGANDISYARIIFDNSSACEIDMSQSGGFVGFFLYDAATGSFSPFLTPGENTVYGNGHCSLNGAGTTVARVGNQLRVALNMTFDLSFAGSHRVAASVCDSAMPQCSSYVTLGTWQVPLTAAINQVVPSNGKQGTSLSFTIFGANTHFANTSSIAVSGTGVAVSGISAFSPTQISATLGIDANATAGPRTVTVTSGTEVLTTTFTVGASGRVQMAPAGLSFPLQLVGTTSAAKTVTLTNTGNAALAIASINAVGEFGTTNDCGASLAVNASCTVSVTFSPLLGGYRSGNVVIDDDASGSPHFLPLVGLGNAVITALRPSRPNRPSPNDTPHSGVATLAIPVRPRVARASAPAQASATLLQATFPAAVRYYAIPLPIDFLQTITPPSDEGKKSNRQEDTRMTHRTAN
jgi:hypothetical protein